MKPSSLPPLGLWLETVNFAACEIAASIGFRIAMLDMEHGVIGTESADRLISFCRALKLEVHVRVAAAERVPIQMALDAGADAVILPQIAGKEHAAVAAAYAKFPPLGSRGLGYSRTMSYRGAPDSFPDDENRQRRCYVMIETPGALADVDAIAALPAVDGLFVGPGDLSLTRGRGVNRWRDADFTDMAVIAGAAQRVGKLWAYPTGSTEVFARARSLRPEFVIIADDLSALQAGLAQSFSNLCDSAQPSQEDAAE